MRAIIVQCKRTKQRFQVIGQHHGRDIDNQRLLTQSRDCLQLHVMFEPLERLFDTALVIKLAKALPEETTGSSFVAITRALALEDTLQTNRTSGAVDAHPIPAHPERWAHSN